MSMTRNLPIGIQDFKDIRVKGFLYVDKTEYVYRLADTGKVYFLSRPRRFGKSLLISTLKAYFQGKKELFEGLAIAQLEKEWTEYPVFHLDLNAADYKDEMALEEILSRHLYQWEDTWGRNLRESSLSSRFMGTIQRAYEQTGHQVVILIDEYDKPLLQNLFDEELQNRLRNMLKGFYGVLKSADKYLRFALLTGVTKFSQVSVFSDLNQLDDISMNADYSSICGITREELLQNFRPELERLAREQEMSFTEALDKMERQYDGYHFCHKGEGMFNPFSVLNALKSRDFRNYWFATGTPTFLIEWLKRCDYDIRNLVEGIQSDESYFMEYRADLQNPIPMIYQSGYLTIKGYDKEYQLYTLGFPNDEVRYAFLKYILPLYAHVPDDSSALFVAQFRKDIEAGNVESFMERLRVLFANIPYDLSDNTERHYQAVFYIFFVLLGQFIRSEVKSSHGRADVVVHAKGTIYVFEFKLNGTAEQALQQIDDKDYLIPYTLEGKKLVKIGVSFSKETRNIDRYIAR